ncbi:hypothetical protein THAOC_27302 [Thalassiosira oceanica]|uniref:Uncharacterized protein n=1 Tax=Thalassiosira oceanica TaxID=159749 RepID=K0RLW9_THAOC|nr:hypothetical protein THAOC_27302 [Thalassiosira oceanica]|eukprot:EJK53289.1 hypothetical protein THAOC_27302 [Thalassiosira oceanica]
MYVLRSTGKQYILQALDKKAIDQCQGAVDTVKRGSEDKRCWLVDWLLGYYSTHDAHFNGQNWFPAKTISKNSISVDARRTARFLRFRRFGPWSRTFRATLHRGKKDRKSRLAHQAGTHHQVDSRRKSRQSSAFRQPAARHERLDIAEAIMWWRFRSGSVNVPPGGPEEASVRCCLLYRLLIP